MVMPLIIANIECLKNMTFFAAVVYDGKGDRIDELIVEFEGYGDAIQLIQSQLFLSHNHRFEVWTSNRELYVECQRVPGIATQFKHKTDTTDTAQIIERDKDILTDLYDAKPLPELSTWRARAFYYLLKLTLKTGGITQ